MNPDDLAARYGGAHRKSGRIELGPEEFERARQRDAADRWGVGALVTDVNDRVLLVREDDTWLLPGGMREPGESHAEGAVREVREETGVDVEVETLAAISEQTFVHGETGETFDFHFATFRATPRGTDTADDPGIADETIEEVAWKRDLPEDTFDRDLVETLRTRDL